MKYAAVVALLGILLAMWWVDVSRAQSRDAAPATLECATHGQIGPMREMASALAGHPQPGEMVAVGLAQHGVPGAFNATESVHSTMHVTGKLLAFDEGWVGLESAGTGRKLWVPRENVAYVINSIAAVEKKKD